MSKILIVVHQGAIARNILETNFLPSILASGHRIVIATPPSKVREYSERFTMEGVSVVSVSRGARSRGERIVGFLARNAFMSQHVAIRQWRDYLDGKTWVHPLVKYIFAILGTYTPGFRRWIRWLELCIGPSREISEVMDEEKPDLVFATAIMSDELDVPILREASRRGILTAAMTRTWDNLSSYGFIRVIPDLFLAQSVYISERALEMHDIPQSSVKVIGTPHYDLNFDSSLIESRNEFFKKIGADPSKRLVVYGAVGDFHFPAESNIADIFESIVNSRQLQCEAQMLYRAHPSYESPLEKMSAMRHVLPERCVTYLSDSKRSWEMRRSDILHLINVLHHADVLISPGSTMCIDAVAFNKPVIVNVFDGQDMPYWFSIRRFFERSFHLKALIATGGVHVAHNASELISCLNEALLRPEVNAVGRKKLRSLFIDPYDGKSGARLAKQLINLLEHGEHLVTR